MRRCCLMSMLVACGPSVATPPEETTSSSSSGPSAGSGTTTSSSASSSTLAVDESTGTAPCPTPIELVEDVVLDDTTDTATLECVTRIDGTLTIGPSTTLDAPLPLAHLVEVTGPILIEGNAALTSLEGLESLAIVSDDFYIAGNPVLTTTAALRGIERAHSVAISDNPMLSELTLFAPSLQLGAFGVESIDVLLSDLPAVTNLDGLAHITETVVIADTVFVLLYGNSGLTDISGLSPLLVPKARVLLHSLAALTEIDLDGVRELRTLTLDGNAALSSLTGLGDLERLERFELYGPHALTSLVGLDNLTTVEHVLWIGECASDVGEPEASALVSLDGLGALQQVGSLRINNQPELTSLAGLSDTVAIEELTLRHNPALPEAEALDYAATVLPLYLTDICGNEDGAACSELRCVFPD